jgi:hypothetical protein
MKKLISRIVIVSGLILGLSWAADAQIIVRVRPSVPVVRVRPVPPSPRHIWIDGGWVIHGRNYVWSDGYWAVPRRGHRYVNGHWDRRRGGWAYVPGHWRRGRY